MNRAAMKKTAEGTTMKVTTTKSKKHLTNKPTFYSNAVIG